MIVVSHSYRKGGPRIFKCPWSKKNIKSQKGEKKAHKVLLANYTLGMEFGLSFPPSSNNYHNNKRIKRKREEREN